MKPTHPPYRKRQIISVLLLIFCFSGLLGVQIVKYRTGESYLLYLLLHAFEGGLVGGLCDWFAVWKTYKAIEQDSEKLADEIGKWVATDLLNHETLRFQINNLLDNPNIQEGIIKILNDHWNTEEQIKVFLIEIWNRYEENIVNYVLNSHIDINGFRIMKTSFTDRHIFYAVKFCIGESLLKMIDSKEWKELYQTIYQSGGAISKLFMNVYKDNFVKTIKEYGCNLKQRTEHVNSEHILLNQLVDLLIIGGQEYLLSWNRLDPVHKREFIVSLLDKAKEIIAQLLSKFLLAHKNQLEEAKILRDYMPTRLIAELIESNLDETVSLFIGRKISERLKSLNPKDFRNKMEWKTRRILENIRINGTVLGFVLGLVLGVALEANTLLRALLQSVK
jgi:uncharacterized membrane-anchored protein YjiN (DUF445 family)